MKNKKLPNLISILVLTLITVVMWITLNIYRAISTSTRPSVPDEISSPLTPNLDEDTINAIESKIFLDESQIPNVNFTLTATPGPTSVTTAIPTEIPPPTASPSATVTPTPTATP